MLQGMHMVQFKIYTTSRFSDSVWFTFMLFGENSTVSPSSRVMLIPCHPIVDPFVEGYSNNNNDICVGDLIFLGQMMN